MKKSKEEKESGFGSLIKTLIVYQSNFLDIPMIGRLSQINKHWNEALKRDIVKTSNHSFNKQKLKKKNSKKGLEKICR